MYDPMVAKLIVWDVDREQATARMLRALREFEITGLKTLLPFHIALLQTDQWARRRDLPRPGRGQGVAEGARLPQAGEAGRGRRGGGRRSSRPTPSRSPGKRFDVTVIGPPPRPRRPTAPRRRAPPRGRKPRGASAAGGGGGGGADTLTSPIQGTVLKVAVEQGAAVEEGALICVIEAMKMENEITAHKAGTVAELPIAVGASVASGDTLAVIKAAVAAD